jgi:hypothetical protein
MLTPFKIPHKIIVIRPNPGDNPLKAWYWVGRVDSQIGQSTQAMFFLIKKQKQQKPQNNVVLVKKTSSK